MRIFYVHWNRDEARDTVRALRDAGHTVVLHWDPEEGPQTWKRFKAKPPDALVVSLERLPSHGRRVAAVTKETKALSEIPVIFVGGARDKLPAAKREFPRATFTTDEEILDALSNATAS
jgi:CheY-like chemotaxis protein